MTEKKRQFDLFGQQVGVVYAQAFMNAAEAEGTVDALIEELGAVANDAVAAHPKFDQFLASPMIGVEEKIESLDRVFSERVTPLILNFLKVLAEHERLGYLSSIVEQIHALHNQRRGRIRVGVTTATPLTDAMASDLTKRIQSLLGLDPELVPETDPSVIGGLMLRIGDTVYDGSVATQLERVRHDLHDRTVEAIEKSRERFQYESESL